MSDAIGEPDVKFYYMSLMPYTRLPENEADYASLWVDFPNRLYDPVHGHALLNRRRVPTLVLWGRHDRMLPAEQATVWGRLLPQAEVRVLESCGHGLVVDDAAAVQAVQDFMTRAD